MRKLLIVSLLVNVILIAFFFIPTKSQIDNIKPTEEIAKSEVQEMPWLNLNKEYFSIRDLHWGSFTGKVEGDINSYDNFAIDNISNFQSYPITDNLEIINYSSEIKELNNKTYDEMYKQFNKNEPDGFGKWAVDESYQKYGKLALHYLPEDYITSIVEFDVDGDEIPEKIITHNFVGSADAGSYSTDIVKNNKIIFSTTEDNSSILKSETGNGFYVEWNNSKYGYARCCQEGFTRTRFIYKDNQFIPVYEQEVRYLKIGNK